MYRPPRQDRHDVPSEPPGHATLSGRITGIAKRTKAVGSSFHSDGKSVEGRERAQLFQCEPTATSSLRDHDAGPYALRPWRFTGFLSAPPAARAAAADRLGALICGHRPSVRVTRARANHDFIDADHRAIHETQRDHCVSRRRCCWSSAVLQKNGPSDHSETDGRPPALTIVAGDGILLSRQYACIVNAVRTYCPPRRFEVAHQGV